MEILEKEIGEVAGKIWNALSAHKGMSRSKLAQVTGLSTTLLNEGIGWLAREGKLESEKKNRTEIIRLKDQANT